MLAVDSLRADATGRGLTPTLDRLAAEGTSFGRAYASAPWATASLAGVFTGKSSDHHGIASLEHELAGGFETLAEVLARSGYEARAVVSDFLVGTGRGLDRGFSECSMTAARGPGNVSTTEITDEVVERLEALADSGQPFFLFAHYGDPAPALQNHTDTDPAVLQAGGLRGGESLALLRVMARDASEAELAALAELYAGEVRHVDRGVAKVLATLERTGLEPRTAVVVFGTHGIALGERGGVGGGLGLREEQLRVPLIVRAPRGVPRGKRVVLPVSLDALFPTALHLLGLPQAPGLAVDSLDLAWSTPLPEGGAAALDPRAVAPVLARLDLEPRDLSQVTHQRAVIGLRYKLILDAVEDRVELFDLELDPRELDNLAELRGGEVRRLGAFLIEE